MKTTLTTIALLIGMLCSAQTEFKTVNRKKIANIEHATKLMVANGDSSYYLSISFRNFAYQHIVDYGTLTISSTGIESFLNAFEVMANSSAKEYVSIDFLDGRMVSDKFGITIYNKKGQYYMINRKKIVDVVAYINENLNLINQ